MSPGSALGMCYLENEETHSTLCVLFVRLNNWLVWKRKKLKKAQVFFFLLEERIKALV